MSRGYVVRKVVVGFVVAAALLGVDVRPAGAGVVTPTGVASDCSKDVTAALTSLLGTAPPDTTVLFARNGCYRVDGTVALAGRRNLLVDGNGSTFDGHFVVGARDRRHFELKGGSNIRFTNMRIVGARNPAASGGQGLLVGERQYGVMVGGVVGFTLDHSTVVNTLSDWVQVNEKVKTLSRNVRIVDNRFAGSGRMGISGSGVDGLTIERNIVDLPKRTAFDFEASTGAANVVITNNDVLPSDHAFIKIGCADRGTGLLLNEGPFTVTNNRVYGQALKAQYSCPAAATITTLAGNTGNLPVATFPKVV